MFAVALCFLQTLLPLEVIIFWLFFLDFTDKVGKCQTCQLSRIRSENHSFAPPRIRQFVRNACKNCPILNLFIYMLSLRQKLPHFRLSLICPTQGWQVWQVLYNYMHNQPQPRLPFRSIGGDKTIMNIIYSLRSYYSTILMGFGHCVTNSIT